MVIRHKKTWLALVAFGIAWAFCKIFALLSEPLDDIVTLALIVFMLTYNGIVLWEERRERQADPSA